jgi:hypothetical protein
VDGELAVIHVDRYDMRVDVTLPELKAVPEAPAASSVSPAPDTPHSALGGGRALPAPDPAISPALRPATLPRGPDPRLEAEPEPGVHRGALLQSLEALRFGVAPTVRLDKLTAGYKRLERWIGSRLPHSNDGLPQVSEIWGPFGAGKSHASAVVRHVANEFNYLTAHVEVDGVGTTLSDPAGLLHALWNTLEGPGFRSSTPILHLMEVVVSSVRFLPRFVPRGIDRIRENMLAVRFLSRAGRLDVHAYQLDALLCSSDEYTAKQVLEQIRRDLGYSPADFALRPMIGRRVVDRPYDFVEALGGLALLAQLAGFSGLAVTIDEFEVETWFLSAQKRERVRDVLTILGDYLRGETDHKPAPLALFFATTGDTDTRGDQFIRTLVASEGSQRYSVRGLDRRARGRLGREICDLYRDAYNLTEALDDQLIARVESELASRLSDSDGTRVFIKSLTGLLDERHGPSRSG